MRVGVGNDDHAGAAAAPAQGAASRRDRESRNARRVRDAGEAYLYEYSPRRRERTGRPLEVRFVRRVPDCGRDRPRVSDGGADLAQHCFRDGTERAGSRVLRIDEIGAACERGGRLSGVRDADQQVHGGYCIIRHLVIW